MRQTREQRFREIASALQAPHKDAMAFHYRAQMDVARRAELVVGHEGWQVYLDHLTAWKDRLTTRRDATLKKLAGGPELGDALTVLKLELRELDGELRALDRAMTLIPELIEHGAQAREKLDALSSDRSKQTPIATSQTSG